MRIWTVLIPLFFSFAASAQTVQWASKVLGFSSEYSPKQYGAKQVLGQPNVMPAGGESPSAWSPLKPSSRAPEYIHVAFAQPMPIQQIAIAESFHPGAITEVWTTDTDGKERRVYSGKIEEVGDNHLWHYVNMPLTSYKVQSVKVVLETYSSDVYRHIDAIGISDGKEPIIAVVSTPDDALRIAAPKNLGERVNSAWDEIMPVISGNGKVLYMDRKDHPKNTGGIVNDDIWRTDWEPETKWWVAENLGAPLCNRGHNFLCGTTYDGNTALLGNNYLDNGTVEAGLSMSHLVNGRWTMPKRLQVADYYNNNRYSEFAMSADAKTLLMAVERSDALGARDIYVSFGDSTAGYSVPLNLGPIINTASPEIAPFLASDGVTLYFSSSGHSGYGNKDLFMSRRLDDSWQKWTAPVNLGSVINSPAWDGYFSVTADGKHAYICTDNDGFGKTDIFEVDLPPSLRPYPVTEVAGQIMDTKNDTPQVVQITCLDPPQDRAVFPQSIIAKGELKAYLQVGFQYEVKVLDVDQDNAPTVLDLRQSPAGGSVPFVILAAKEAGK